MEYNNRLNQDGEVVLALEALGALEVLEDMVDALDAKVDSLDRRIDKAEARLEEIVAEQR
jgi:ribosome-associated translation inhibitor RaiA